MRRWSALTLQEGHKLGQLPHLVLARSLCSHVHHWLLGDDHAGIAINQLPAQTGAQLGHSLGTLVDHLGECWLKDVRVSSADEIDSLLLVAVCEGTERG